MIEICKIKILNAIGKHLFDDPIYIVIREIQSSMLQRYFRFGLNRTTSVRKSFVFLTARDAKERNYMKRNRPPRRRIGPNGQLESEGASQDKQRVRLTAILTGLQQTGRVSVETLSKQLGVSVVTVRRDLDALDEKGLLRRTHGGAVSIEPLFYEQFRRDQSFLAQEKHASDEKRRIGRAAAALITAGETIALTPGTTTTEVIRGLPINSNIMVVTNTVNVAMELSQRKDVYVFVTGGHLHGEWFSLVGTAALRSLDNMLINTVFIGADGMDATWGASCFNADEAELNSTMMKLARRRVAVVDSSKLGLVANWRICKPEELHVLVTDSGATDEMVAPYMKLGIKVMRV
jgi:DeoR family transcriptional regulator of aga operon